MKWYPWLFSSLAVVAYTYLLYTLLLWILAGVLGRKVKKGAYSPHISVIIPAHNEGDSISRKLADVFSCDYPRELLEVMVVSDASTDSTDAAVEEFTDGPVQLLRLSRRSGKAAAINLGARHARGDILVFMDARQKLGPGALRALISNFADREVGFCTGELSLISEAGPPQALSLYWTYERWLRRCESQLHSVTGGSGALMAIRRSLFSPLDPVTILDDVVLPLRVVAAGFRSIHEPKAQILDASSRLWAEESARKARTLAGNFQLLFHPKITANPFTPRIAFQFVSHKLLRLLIPAALALMFISSAAISHPAARVFTDAQVLFYCVALAGWLGERIGARLPLLSVPFVFVSLQIAIVRGLFRYLTGRERGRW